MRAMIVLCWLSPAVLLGCEGQQGKEVKMEASTSSKAMTLRISPWQSVDCRLVQRDGKLKGHFQGQRIVYQSGPRPPANYDYPIALTAVDTFGVGNHWIGPDSDLYICDRDNVVGLKVYSGGIRWFTNLAKERKDGKVHSLADVIRDFEQSTSGDQLFEEFRRCCIEEAPAGARDAPTSFANVIPKPYREYLQQSSPGSAVPGTPRLVSAEMDGKLLKLTISDQSSQMFPSIWIDLDTRKAVKASNYEFDPSAEIKAKVKELMRDL